MWKSIDYRPAIESLPPAPLVSRLPLGGSVLDVGCHRGREALYLADRGFKCLGIDINESAIQQARQNAAAHPQGDRVTFRLEDFMTMDVDQTFDAITLIRTLTCWPRIEDWRAALNKVWQILRPGGMVYIHDFAEVTQSSLYPPRYAEGHSRGWGRGNFAVSGANGALLFVAHHHSPEEIELISAPYDTVFMERHESVSMNGNRCAMFQWIGRKPE